MSASRTGRPRAAWRSTKRAGRRPRPASAALPTWKARTRPPVTTIAPQLTVDLEQLHERRVSDLVDQPRHVEAGPDRPRAVGRADQSPAVLDRLLQPGPLALQHRSSSRRRPGPRTDAGRWRAARPGDRPAPGRSAAGRGLGQRAPPALAPPQLRPCAGVNGVALRQPGQLVPLHRSQRPQLGAAQRGPVVVECVQPASAGVPHPPHLAALVPVERLGEPGRGPDQPGRVTAVAGGRCPQRPSRRPARRRLQPGPRATTRSGRPPTGPPRAGGPAAAAVFGEREPLGADPSPGREHHQFRPCGRHLPPLAPEAVACGPGRSQGRVGVAPGQLAERQVELELGRGSPAGSRSLASSSFADRACLAREPGGQQRLAPVLTELDRRVRPSARTRLRGLRLVVQPSAPGRSPR